MSILASPYPGDSVDRLRGYRKEYLLGLRVEGRRIAILLDHSASMTDERLIDVIARKVRPDAEKKQGPRWRRTQHTARWLLHRPGAKSRSSRSTTVLRRSGARTGPGIAPASHLAHARSGHRARGPEVGGIPVDSEYVIFIVDTSGSMKSIWGRVTDVMGKVLDVHPRVSGFQVLNDNGGYLIGAYRGKWIPDTPRRRSSILNAVRNWDAFSNSSPVEGLRTALRAYARQDRKIAVYIFGDDYTGSSYDEVIETLRELNTERGTGRRLVRVHAVGFVSDHTTDRYATLMREVTRTNEGTFLALPP